MRRQLLLVACMGIAVTGCGPRSAQQAASPPKAGSTASEQRAPDLRGALEDTGRRQAAAGKNATAKIRRAYPYKGYCDFQPTGDGKLVAVDVEFAGHDRDFDLDDVDVIDGQAGDNYGSDPQIALLTPDGKLPKVEPKEWPEAPRPLRVLLIYALPRSVRSVRLGYWNRDLTTVAFPIAGVGPSLAPP